MNSWLWAALAAVGGAALWYIMTMNQASGENQGIRFRH